MNDEQKWLYLEGVPHLDAQHPRIKLLAESLTRAAGGEPTRTAQLIMTVARDWIRQTSDVQERGGEDIAGLTRPPTPDDAIDALRRGEDDCDAKARLFVAMCLAAGLEARMIPTWATCGVSESTPKGRTLTHVSAAVELKGVWQPVELTLSRARLGEIGKEVPKEVKTGKWKLS